MLATVIKDKYVNQMLRKQSRIQKKSPSTIARDILLKQLEDAEDYAAAMAVMADIKSGKTTVISSEEMWRRLELDN